MFHARYLLLEYRRCRIFLIAVFTFLIYSLYTNLLYSSKNVADTKTYEFNELSYHNQKCPALNKIEWKIYKNLTAPNIFVTQKERLKLSLKDMGMVTFVSKSHMVESFINCESIQNHSQLRLIHYTVFFSSDISRNQILKFRVACPHANIIKFPFERFPESVQKLEEYRFKAIYQAMTLKNHKILLNFDTSILFNKNADFEKLINLTILNNPLDVTLLRKAGHNMFSTTHPDTFNCFPNINQESMINVPQYQSGLILWIPTKTGWKIMKKFVECSLQQNCIAPKGSTKMCEIHKISKNPTKFSGCHRFDQSVINLILFEISNFQPKLYQKHSNVFKIVRRA